MYSRKAIFNSVDPENKSGLLDFFYGIFGHSMYAPIVDELVNNPGFVKKEMVMVEDKIGRSATTQIIFDNEENFNAYVKNEAYESMWEYLKIMAEQAGISIDIEDGPV